jgi:hypothetical protein
MTETVKSASSDIAPPQPSLAPSDPLWARLLLPSAADIIFLAFFWMLAFGVWSRGLLADADTGWHIRNGEHILKTLSVPHTDYFSYTMAGRPWYAWEWLYDALIGAVHMVAGLNGVVLLTALIIALTFALLFRYAVQAGGNVVIAAVLTIVAGAASTIHFLARPHVLSWLLTLLWLRALQRFQNRERKHLYSLPLLMVLWANLHGGFLMGLMLLGVFLAADLWTWRTASCPKRRGRAKDRARHLTLISVLSLAATFVTPYGYRLHLHLREYLGSRFMMDNISEFLTPDFHSTPAKFFALLLALSITALALAGTRLKAVDFLLVLFSVWAGLFSARNIPIAAILLTLTITPVLSDAIRRTAERNDVTLRLRALATSFDSFGARMGEMENRFRMHILPLALIAATIAISLNQGQAFGRTMLAHSFSEKHMPVAATKYLLTHNVHDHFFSPDNWGGYLIYI